MRSQHRRLTTALAAAGVACLAVSGASVLVRLNAYAPSHRVPRPTVGPRTFAAPEVVQPAALQVGTDLISNGTFTADLTGWQLHATPSAGYLVWTVANGVFEFTRTAPPAGTTNQATIFQTTGAAVPSGTPLQAQFDLGNTSSVRKRISVVVLDGSFSDLSVCTFWLPPNTPLGTYQMRTHTTSGWTNASIYFYAATTGSNGGAYQIDNVSLREQPGGPVRAHGVRGSRGARGHARRP